MQVFSSLTNPRVSSILLSGGIGVIPTDTVYGLVARAEHKQAVERLYDLKKRARQPGTIIAANIEQLHTLGFAYHALHIADQFWPDALSVIIDASSTAKYLKTTLSDLPVRIPNHEHLLRLLRQTGPLMTTSANHPHQPTATDLTTARNYFADQVDFYVDGGELSGRPPSTIIRITDGRIIVVRHGAVTMSPYDRD